MSPLNEQLLDSSGSKGAAPKVDEDAVISKKGIFFSFLMILINIPALIGA